MNEIAFFFSSNILSWALLAHSSFSSQQPESYIWRQVYAMSQQELFCTDSQTGNVFWSCAIRIETIRVSNARDQSLCTSPLQLASECCLLVCVCTEFASSWRSCRWEPAYFFCRSKEDMPLWCHCCYWWLEQWRQCYHSCHKEWKPSIFFIAEWN